MMLLKILLIILIFQWCVLKPIVYRDHLEWLQGILERDVLNASNDSFLLKYEEISWGKEGWSYYFPVVARGWAYLLVNVYGQRYKMILNRIQLLCQNLSFDKARNYWILHRPEKVWRLQLSTNVTEELNENSCKHNFFCSKRRKNWTRGLEKWI